MTIKVNSFKAGLILVTVIMHVEMVWAELFIVAAEAILQ